MDLTSLQEIKEIFSKYQAKPSKGLGQNFLIDENVLEKIITAAEIKPDDFILEVGPGIGTLTKELAQKAKQVVAIEKDKTMVEILAETLSEYKNIKIIHGDILKTENIFPKSYKVVANIPYYLTSPLIRKFLESKNPPEQMILMLQKEVAERICAKPGKMSLLAVSVQFYADAKIISTVSKNCFWPAPKVDSAIIKIIPRGPTSTELSSKLLGGRASPELFFKIVKAGFIQPRKQLVNNLSSLKSPNGVKLTKDKISEWLLANKINPNQRAETLSISDWINLTKSFNF